MAWHTISTHKIVTSVHFFLVFSSPFFEPIKFGNHVSSPYWRGWASGGWVGAEAPVGLDLNQLDVVVVRWLNSERLALVVDYIAVVDAANNFLLALV